MSQQIHANENLESNVASETSDLLTQAQKLQAKFSSYTEALTATQQELKTIAGNMNLTIESLLAEAENSTTYNELFLRALSLQSQVRFYKTQIK